MVPPAYTTNLNCLSLGTTTNYQQTSGYMKTSLSFLLFLLSALLLPAQTIESPTFKARNGSIRNITRIERTSECTKVYIHAIFRPHWWITEDGESYLEDAATGKRYAQTGAEGIELKKKTYMPDSGETDFILLFEPLPKEVQAIHLIDPNGNESNTYDISLVPAPKDDLPLKQVEGNWFTDDTQGHWTYGIHDSLVIMNNRLYDLTECRKKGKRIMLTARNRIDKSTATLQLTPRKDGSCLIALNGDKAQRCVRTRPDTPAIQADNGYGEDFFRRDSVCLQGYLDGYDSRLGFDSGILYIENEISRQDFPTVVPIHPDGSFQCEFALQHPVCQNLFINNNGIPFYAEPGDTITLYLDWEDLLARSRARDHLFPLPHTAYMGKKADLSYLTMTLSQHFNYSYDKLLQAQKTLTPAQFQEQLKPTVTQWQQQADSLSRLYAPSQKGVSLIRNQMAIQTGYTYLEYLMSRSYYVRQDSTNQALQVQPDASYYNFLKEMPLNEQSVLANSYISVFINRFEYMEPLNAAYKIYAGLPKGENFKALSDEEKQVLHRTAISEVKDSIASSLCATASPLLWQIARVRDLRYTLPQIQNRRNAELLISRLERTVTHPYLQATAREMLEELCPKTKQASYQLPEGKATDIFRRIIAPHAGKMLFVDFWATTCAPCRGGIQATANLRKQYHNHPEFQFIYITSERESPQKAYTEYVEKHLKGEACYRLTDTEYKYMRQLFRFNGIPHYVVVEKDGSISTEEVSAYNLGDFLKRRFEDKQ